MDVVLTTLPFHARRGLPRQLRPLFPSTDPACTNEGFAHAVQDIRALIYALRARGSTAVGVTGMSLGAYTTALLATVEASVDAVIPVIPFASYPLLLWTHGEGGEGRRRAEAEGLTYAQFEAAFAATIPVKRAPLVAPEKVLIVSGERDRVTPAAHGRMLQQHFSTRERDARMVTFRGGHILQVDRRGVFGAIAKMLAEQGLIPPRRKRELTTPAAPL